MRREELENAVLVYRTTASAERITLTSPDVCRCISLCRRLRNVAVWAAARRAFTFAGGVLDAFQMRERYTRAATRAVSGTRSTFRKREPPTLEVLSSSEKKQSGTRGSSFVEGVEFICAILIATASAVY